MRKIQKKKSYKGLVLGIIISLLTLGIVGSVGYLSKGFRNWNYQDWLDDVFNQNYIPTDELSTGVFSADYSEFNEDIAINYLNERYDSYLNDGGCSAMAKQVDNGDTIVARNMDLYMTNKPSYVVRTNLNGKYKTIGLAYSNKSGDDMSVVRQRGIEKGFYNVIPVLQTDVMNSEGFYIEINMRNATYDSNGESIFSCDGTNHGKKRVLASVLPYYLGTRCSSVNQAIQMVTNDLDLFTPIPSEQQTLDWNFAFMMADSTGCYGVLEIAKDRNGNQKIVFNKGKDSNEEQTDKATLGSIQANYYLSSDFADREKIGSGYGRVDYLQDLYPNLTNEEKMLSAIKDVSYFQVYDREHCKFDNKSEFVGYYAPNNYFDEFQVWDIDFINNPSNEDVINDYIDYCKERIQYYQNQGTLYDVGLFWDSTFTLTANVNKKTLSVRFYENESNKLVIHF